MNDEQRRQETVEIQMNCRHDPQSVAGMPYVKRCSKCLKFFGNHEADMIDFKRKQEAQNE